MPADIMFTGRLIVSLLDAASEVLSLTVELDGAMPTAAALALLHPVERVAVETCGVEQRFLTVEVFAGDLRACAKQLRVGHPISGHGRHVDLISGFTTRYQFHLGVQTRNGKKWQWRESRPVKAKEAVRETLLRHTFDLL